MSLDFSTAYLTFFPRTLITHLEDNEIEEYKESGLGLCMGLGFGFKIYQLSDTFCNLSYK